MALLHNFLNFRDNFSSELASSCTVVQVNSLLLFLISRLITIMFAGGLSSIANPTFGQVKLLWSPYGIGQTIIFSSVVSSSFFFSSPNLSRRRLDVCHTSTHGVALVQI